MLAEESGRTRFHYGFYAAMEVEYGLAKIPLTYEQEVELGKDPVRLDFLIIKKQPDIMLHDPIGEFFKLVNIFEYKSPEDGLSIDDFYKVQGYGLIYKGFGRKVNELPIEDITLTLVRHVYPRDMIKALREVGITVNNIHQGIYRFEGKISIPVQLVVSSQLPVSEYDGLKLLAKGTTIDDIIRYAERAVASGDNTIKENAGTVIGISLSVNKKLSKQLKEAGNMNAAVKNIIRKELRDLFSEDFVHERQAAVNEEKERVAVDMLKDGEPIEKIIKYSRLAENTIRTLAISLGTNPIL